MILIGRKKYIGLNVDTETLDKIQILSFITKKHRTLIILEALDDYFIKHNNDFSEFKKYVESKIM